MIDRMPVFTGCVTLAPRCSPVLVKAGAAVMLGLTVVDGATALALRH